MLAIGSRVSSSEPVLSPYWLHPIVVGHPSRSIAALCLVASTHAVAHEIEGLIVGVRDGDTITLLDVDNRQH
jgi:hypothetical protein